MPLFTTPPRDREVLLPIVVELHLLELEGFFRDLTLDGNRENLIGNKIDGIWQLVSWDQTIGLSGHCIIVIPWKACSSRLLPRQRIVELRGCLVVTMERDLLWEELAPLTSALHMSDDARHKNVVLLFGVLLIEDTKALVVHVDASEAIATPVHVPAVREVTATHVAVDAEEKVVAVFAADTAFERLLQVRAVLVSIVNILRSQHDLIAILATLHVLTVIAAVGVFAVL